MKAAANSSSPRVSELEPEQVLARIDKVNRIVEHKKELWKRRKAAENLPLPNPNTREHREMI